MPSNLKTDIIKSLFGVSCNIYSKDISPRCTSVCKIKLDKAWNVKARLQHLFNHFQKHLKHHNITNIISRYSIVVEGIVYIERFSFNEILNWKTKRREFAIFKRTNSEILLLDLFLLKILTNIFIAIMEEIDTLLIIQN